LNATTIIIAILIIILLIVALFIIPRWRSKRALRQVIQIFRNSSATDTKNAKTAAELGLGPTTMREEMFRRRDYKPYALNALIKAEIIQRTEDGKLYLAEDRLMASGIEGRISKRR
jgi:flagellar basal body-associated protein FliL